MFLLRMFLEFSTITFLEFNSSSPKSEHFHFDGLFLSKAYKYLDENVHKNYVS